MVANRAGIRAVLGVTARGVGRPLPELFALSLYVKKASFRDLGIWKYSRQGDSKSKVLELELAKECGYHTGLSMGSPPKISNDSGGWGWKSSEIIIFFRDCLS